jgi:tyrosine aminotransferase
MLVKINIGLFDDIKSDSDFCEKIYDEQDVKVMPGSFFSAPNYIRIVVC